MDLFDKYAQVMKARGELPLDGEDPFSVCVEELISQTEAIIKGRRTILAGTNNYLGLTHNPDGIKGAHDALDRAGTGTTGSRMANGTYTDHQRLEKTLCEFYGTSGAIVFSTGYQANLAMISSLAGADDYILIDADSHASIYDGCKLGNATVVRFRHNDPADLDKRLGRLDGEEAACKLIVVEGIYSMLGDCAPLDEIAEIKRKHGAYLLVDEAHSLGVLGEHGRGLAEELAIEDDIDFVVGTFSKSVGTIGGYCVSNHPRLEIIRLVARPYIFTASLPPSVVASAIANIGKIKESRDLRRQLMRNAQNFADGLAERGFDIGAHNSPIVTVKAPSLEQAARFWAQLMKDGLYVNLALPPATPQGLYLLRASLCAAHTDKQVDEMIRIFDGVADKIEAGGGPPFRAALSERRRAGEGEETAKSRLKSGAASATG